MNKKHQKHTKLKRPALGQFHRNEWAILGTPCGKIQQLGKELTQRMSSNYRLGYVDATHSQKEPADDTLAQGGVLEYTDNISFHQLNKVADVGLHQYRQWFNETDGVLVNGNHFKAKKQIVVLDEKKKESLSRKLDRLTAVCLFLRVDGVGEVYDFLKETIPDWAKIPVLSLEDTEAIADLLSLEMKKKQAPLYGLILAGGKSQRMGIDKGSIDYHGLPQREYLADLLAPFCEKTFLSLRPEQAETVKTELPILTDSFVGLGPEGAILSAFREEPDAAWLVVACDLPLLDKAALTQLTENRNRSKVATAFLNPETNFPDPLITIWEPRSYPIALQFLAQGYSCPRKVLINSAIELLEAENPAILKNVNTREEMEAIKKLL